MEHSTFQKSKQATLAVVCLLTAGTCTAATQWWDASTNAGLQAGTGVWSTTDAYWATNATPVSGNGPFAWNNGNDAVFSVASTATVNGVTANSISAQASTVLLLPGTGALTNGGGGIALTNQLLIACPIVLSADQTWSINNITAQRFDGAISGPGRLTVRTGANSFNGAFTLTNTADAFNTFTTYGIGGVPSSYGALSVAAGTIANGLTLGVPGGSMTNSASLTINGIGTTVSAVGDLNLASPAVLTLNSAGSTNTLAAGSLIRQGHATLEITAPNGIGAREILTLTNVVQSNGIFAPWVVNANNSLLTYLPGAGLSNAVPRSIISFDANAATQYVTFGSGITLSGSSAVQAFYMNNNTLNLNGNTLAVGDGVYAGIVARNTISNSGSSGGMDFGTAETLVYVNNGQSSTFACRLAGTNSLTKFGNGALTLQSPTPYAGPIWLNNGTLTLAPTADMTVTNAIIGMGTLGVTGLPQLTLKATNQIYTLSLPNGHLAIDGGRIIATGMNPTGTNMTLALNNGGALYTQSGITFGTGTSGGNTGLVTSGNAPGLGGVWDFGGNGLILASAFSANANNNNLTFNNVTITNLTSLGGGDTGTKMANTLILTNSARLYCTSVNVASKGGYTNQFLVTGGSKLYVNGGITLAFNGTIANTLKVDGLGVPGGATIVQDGGTGSTVGGNWDGSTVLTNSLIVTNGGWFVHTNAATTLTIGYAGASGSVAGNALLVTGAGAVLNGGGNFSLDIADGYSSSPAVGNYVSIANGGVATNIGNIWIGNGYANSPIAFGNLLIVTNGGRLYSGNVTIGNSAGHSNNQYSVDGSLAGCAITNGAIAVGGNAANNNSMTIANATLLSSTLTVGSAASNNSVVAYNGARWTLGNQSVSIGAGVSSGNTLRVEAGGFMTNVATLTIGSAATSCGNGVTLNGGGLSASGLTMNIGTNNAFAFNSGLLQLSTATVSNGLPFLVGDGGAIPAELNLTGGTNATQALSFFNGLAIANNGILSGSGRIVSPAAIAGTLAPGGVGATTGMVFTSNLTLTATAVVKLDLAGKVTGVSSDFINAAGQTVDLGGATLQVRIAPGYTPARTDVFTNLVAGTLLNTFGNVSGGRVALTQPAATMAVSTSGNRITLSNYTLSLGTSILFF